MTVGSAGWAQDRMKMPRQAVSYEASLKSCSVADVDYERDLLNQIPRQFELDCVSGFVLLAGKLRGKLLYCKDLVFRMRARARSSTTWRRIQHERRG